MASKQQQKRRQPKLPPKVVRQAFPLSEFLVVIFVMVMRRDVVMVMMIPVMAMVDDDHRAVVAVVMVVILRLGEGCGRGKAAQRDERCCNDLHECLLNCWTNRQLLMFCRV
jgi:hypothetical protein